MKSRRLTIFCVAMIALAGTPRAWQAVGNLLAIAQHKAQVRFWSMVLPPANRASASAETIAAAKPLEASPASNASSCPLERSKSWENQVAGSSNANRSTVPASLQSKARAPQRSPASHGVLTARALKAERGNGNLESLLHSASLPENHLLGIAENHLPSAPGSVAVAALPNPPASNVDSFRFVLIPNTSTFVVPALVDKENIVQLKLMRKSFEDKVIRQRNRSKLRNADFGLRI